jgi:hypothetical protein
MESYGIESLVIDSTSGAVWLNPELSWNDDLAGLKKWMQVAATGGDRGRRRFFLRPDSECGHIWAGPFRTKTAT